MMDDCSSIMAKQYYEVGLTNGLMIDEDCNGWLTGRFIYDRPTLALLGLAKHSRLCLNAEAR